MQPIYKEFDTPMREQDVDEDEERLEQESMDMLGVWNREEILNEIDIERNKFLNRQQLDELYDGEKDFAEIVNEMNEIEETGVYIRLLDANPQGKSIKTTNTVLFDRVSFLEHELSPLESSVVDGKPTKLNLMEGPITAGLMMALTHLKEGESANIMCPPKLSYDTEIAWGFPLVPKGSWLYYYVKIHKVWDESELDLVVEYERTNRIEIPLDEKLKTIDSHREKANIYMKDGEPREALIRYKAAIKWLEETNDNGTREALMTLYINSSIALNQMEMFKSASNMSKRALFLDPHNMKALYQIAKARLGMGDQAGALGYIDRALKLDPASRAFDSLRLKLNDKVREYHEKEQQIIRNMSKAFK